MPSMDAMQQARGISSKVPILGVSLSGPSGEGPVSTVSRGKGPRGVVLANTNAFDTREKKMEQEVWWPVLA